MRSQNGIIIIYFNPLRAIGKGIESKKQRRRVLIEGD